MIYDSGIYGGQDEPEIVYVDRIVERVVHRGGSVTTKTIEKEVVKFPKITIRKLEYIDYETINISVGRIIQEDK